MAMDESAERSDIRRMQREQERERRRIRDRQRRQSMTLEQREKHLARRRRNYQLRRLRAETSRVDSQCQDAGLEEGGEMVSNNEFEAINYVPEISFHSDGVNPVEFIQGEEELGSQSLQTAGVEALAYNLTSRLRLSHIRRLARSLNQSGDKVTGNHQVESEVMPRNDANTTCLQVGDCDLGRSTGGLRLNRVKRLARALNTGTNETNGQSQQCHKETMNNTSEQNLSLGDTQVISSDKSKFEQPISSRGEDELPNVDG